MKKIGKEDAETKAYVQIKQEHKEYILNNVTEESMEIHLIIGLRAQDSLLSSIQAEQLGYTHPWELPIVSIQRNPNNKELLSVEQVGINS